MISSKDRIELMESLGISVIDGTGGDNLYLGKSGIFIPYNIMNFLLFEESKLVNDVLRRFRERNMDNPEAESLATAWNRVKDEIELDNMIRMEQQSIIQPPRENPINKKKENIRNILVDKGLLCSDME